MGGGIMLLVLWALLWVARRKRKDEDKGACIRHGSQGA
jgi:hypothetical protein